MTSQHNPPTHAPRTVVLVTGRAEPAASLDALSVDMRDYDVILVDSIAHGYSRIKQAAPDLIVVCSEIDDAEACQLLSMLKVDSRASRIPVLTCVTSRETNELEVDFAELGREASTQFLAMPMN
jgi:DNA-binding response OmpR family regulator